MQWRALKYFDTVARCHSLRQAASRLHVAPTAVSRQIDQLEHQLGAELLERTHEGVRLTPAGELLADQASRTLRDMERLAARIADLQGCCTGRVSIEVSEGVVAQLLTPALASLQSEYPQLTFDVSIASAGGVIETLRSGKADIGLAYFLPPRDDVVRVATAELEHYAVMAPDHPLAWTSALGLSDIEGYPLAVPDDSFGVRQALNRAARDRKLNMQIAYTTSSLETQKALARQGAAVLLLPLITVAQECDAGQLVAVALHPGELEQTRVDLCVYRHHSPSLAVRTCLARLEEALVELDGNVTDLAHD
jgi:DNA-binding transcriptional LysR family regulator